AHRPAATTTEPRTSRSGALLCCSADFPKPPRVTFRNQPKTWLVPERWVTWSDVRVGVIAPPAMGGTLHSRRSEARGSGGCGPVGVGGYAVVGVGEVGPVAEGGAV